MDPEFWRERWLSGRTAFHQPRVDASLMRHWPAIEALPAGRVLVPLCGKSLDLLWLRDQGHEVVGVELSDIALQAFCVENGIPARRRQLPDFDRFEVPGLVLYGGDFFALTRERLGKVAAVYDRAALVSWTPDLRQRYVDQTAALTPSGVQTLLITLEYAAHEMQGPPFSIGAGEVDRLFAPYQRIRELARRDITAEEPRLRQRGVTRLLEVCYRMTRL